MLSHVYLEMPSSFAGLYVHKALQAAFQAGVRRLRRGGGGGGGLSSSMHEEGPPLVIGRRNNDIGLGIS